MPFVYNLWTDSAFGKDPNRTERAAWIAQDSTGRIEVIRWRRSFARNSESWKGPVPPNVIAQVHTHCVIADPRPSQGDARLANRIKIPVYAISSNGIWKVGPDGKTEKVAGTRWKIKQD